ncbi:MAG: hypothetical protein QOF98_2647 [Streptomyces sp.]|nr:hypothetical protein [Streptomyces sp.]
MRAVLPALAALLLAGCASMPSSGEVRKVTDEQRSDADSQVRVFGIPPDPGESASDIVTGFLEATTSGETDFSTAKKYLSTDAAAKWNPNGKITVYSGSLPPPTDDGSINRREGNTTVSLYGTKAAEVDTKHAYQPDQQNFESTFHLVKQNNEWRIDGLDDGLLLSEPDFQRLYHSVNMYYFADLGPDATSGDGSTRQTLVADPVYLRNQADPLVSTVSALLDGPTDWLAPVATTAAPTGVRLYDKGPDQGVTVDDAQRLRVRLDIGAKQLSRQNCSMLAAQLFATVQAQESAKLQAADVQLADGSVLCSVPGTQNYTSGNPTGASSQQYYISTDGHRLLALSDTGSTGTNVVGPFGADNADLGSVAVRRDERAAAGVRTNGRELVVGSLVDDKPFGQPVLTSNAASAKDGLSAPSWDGFGDLWVADRNPASPRLLMLRNGAGPAHEVSVPGLAGRIESLRVSSDGVRIALVVEENGVMTLQLGRIERGTTQDPDAFSVTGLRSLTPEGEKVTSVSWAGASRLVALGTETGGVQQIQYINTDGSSATAQEGINEATSVAASEDQTRPLLASYNGNVYRLMPADSTWKQVSPAGGSPVYPG